MDYLTTLKQITANQNSETPVYDNTNAPKDLKWLRNLKLTEDEIKKILNEPIERKEDEPVERYKLRRKIRNVLIKYKNDI